MDDTPKGKGMKQDSQRRATALVTGASGGIGLALAKELAKNGHDLVLVARTEDKLERIAAEVRSSYDRKVTVIAKDLTHSAAPEELYQALIAQNIEIDILVNNAGFATYGKFVETSLERELAQLQLNVVTLTHLSKLFLRDMVTRGRGAVLNVASTAAFQPGPLMAVYYATKAYVLSLSEALADELRGTGVTVTALCPGPTESGFQEAAQMQDSRLVQRGLMSAETVAAQGYAALKRGARVVIPGFANQLGAMLPRFLPRQLVTRVVRTMQAQEGH
jgi:short-subunit dehydrogenase